MITGWWQLAEWTPRLLLALGALSVVLIVVVVARNIVGIFRQ
jgi:hypothetical protein